MDAVARSLTIGSSRSLRCGISASQHGDGCVQLHALHAFVHKRFLGRRRQAAGMDWISSRHHPREAGYAVPNCMHAMLLEVVFFA